MKRLWFIISMLVVISAAAYGNIRFSLVKINQNVSKQGIQYLSTYTLQNDIVAFYTPLQTQKNEGYFEEIKNDLGNKWKVDRLYNFGNSSLGGPYELFIAYNISKIFVMNYTLQYIGSGDSVEELTVDNTSSAKSTKVKLYILDEVDISKDSLGSTMTSEILLSQWMNSVFNNINEEVCVIGQFPMSHPVDYINRSLNVSDCIADGVGSYIGDTNTTTHKQLETTHIICSVGTDVSVLKAFVSDYFKDNSVVSIKPPYIVFDGKEQVQYNGFDSD